MATNLQFLESFETDGNVSSLNMDNIFGKGYEQYNMFINLINADGNGGYMSLRFIDNSGSVITGNEYQYAGAQLKSYGSYDNTWASTNANLIAPIMLGSNDDSRGGGAIVRIFNPDIAQYTFVHGKSASYMDSGLDGSIVGACHKAQEIVRGVQLTNHTSKTLKVKIFGVK